MEKISIGKDIDYYDIESSYQILSNHTEVDLYIPASLNSRQLGIYAEIIQLIITWSRLSSGRLFIHYTSSTTDISDKIDTMFQRYWNFVAGCLGYNKGIFLVDGTNISADVAKTIKERINYLKVNPGWRKGDTTFICAVQHSANPHPSAFYLSNGILKSKKEFIQLSKNILTNVATNYIKSSATETIEKNENLIGEIIFELIENTHFWTQEDYKGRSFSTGIRGLLVSVHNGTKETLLKQCKEDEPFSHYLSELNLMTDTINSLVEITVFDTGSGLASKWEKSAIETFSSYDQIYNSIINCLVKNNTSDTGSSYDRGFGLYNIMKLLNQDGFLKIRTNGLKLFRNFKKNPFDDNGTKKSSYFLDDWFKVQKHQVPKYKTSGTLFSIFLPLKKF